MLKPATKPVHQVAACLPLSPCKMTLFCDVPTTPEPRVRTSAHHVT